MSFLALLLSAAKKEDFFVIVCFHHTCSDGRVVTITISRRQSGIMNRNSFCSSNHFCTTPRPTFAQWTIFSISINNKVLQVKSRQLFCKSIYTIRLTCENQSSMWYEAGSKYIQLPDVGEENLENEVISKAIPGTMKQFRKNSTLETLFCVTQ